MSSVCLSSGYQRNLLQELHVEKRSKGGQRKRLNSTLEASLKIQCKNIAVVSEKTDVPHLPNQSMVAISVTKLWPWKLGQGHQNWTSYRSCLIYIGLQIW